MINDAYKKVKEKYLEAVRLAKEDFTNLLPWRQVEWFPNSGNEGLYGWTYMPTDGKINLNDKLQADYLEKFKTDVHESGHTQDERETRYWTEWVTEPLIKFIEKFYEKYKPKKKEMQPAYGF
ncbi:hypothetical protein ACFLZB_03380 [Nanoarchaeota archaeon]